MGPQQRVHQRRSPIHTGRHDGVDRPGRRPRLRRAHHPRPTAGSRPGRVRLRHPVQRRPPNRHLHPRPPPSPKGRHTMSATVTGGPPQIIEVQIPGGPPGPPGPQGPPGASTLTGLTDVTGAQAPGLSPVGDQTGATQEFPLTRVVTQTDLDSLLTLIAEVKWYDLTLENGF